MKKVIRRSVFETNSSSTHSLSILSVDDYEKWTNGEVLLGTDDKIYTREQAIEELKTRKWYADNLDFTVPEKVQEALDENFSSYEDYGEDFDTFESTYTTKSGDEIKVFGYYGTDY